MGDVVGAGELDGAGDGDGEAGAAWGWRSGCCSAAGPPGWQGAPLIRQSAGDPAGPEELVTKPTDWELPGAMSESQLSEVTVTLPPLTVCEPFHRLDRVVPAGSWKDRVQPETAEAPPLVMVYWPV